MSYGRCYSAPPVEKFVVDEDVDLDRIRNNERSFKRYNDEVLNNLQNLFGGPSDHIVEAFVEKKTMVELIDIDHPDSDICTEFSGVSRTNTPIGDKPVVRCEMLNVMNLKPSIVIPIAPSSVQNVEINRAISEIRKFYDSLNGEGYCNIKQTCLVVCKDQEGSRFIQKRLDEWSSEEISWFFGNISDSIIELSTNLFGNYVIQKIIPYLNEEELFKIVVKLFGKVNELSLHTYGCRVIQKLIENIGDIKFIISELANNVLELIASPNGNHVIQKCIDKNIDKDFIIKELEKNAILLAQQRYGCRVLQRIFEVCNESEIQVIYDSIVENLDLLINDKYGNYVIQHLILTPNAKREMIYVYIIKNAFELSKSKYSSNVIEKCVCNGTLDQIKAFLSKFVESEDNKRPNLYYMCTDMYANYVVQRFFDIADKELKDRAKESIKPYVKDMKGSSFSKHILTRIS